MEPKKKRGRKPKNNIVLNENPVFENINDGDNLIACIKKTKKKINEISISDNEGGVEGAKGEGESGVEGFVEGVEGVGLRWTKPKE